MEISQTGGLRKFQQKRALTYSVLEEVKVGEIICSVSLMEDILKFHEWITEKHMGNQEDFHSGVISMDIEDVKASYYNVMHMAGKFVISRESQSFQ